MCVLTLLDGHHKLIRWRFVTHGCIDGYTRMITFIECNTNNRGDTVYKLFLEAASKYGLPSRIRCDYGGENIRVATHMLQHRGLHRKSVITGSSTHNQRIERLWGDVHRSVTKMYYRLFYFLEYHGLLDPLNPFTGAVDFSRHGGYVFSKNHNTHIERAMIYLSVP